MLQKNVLPFSPLLLAALVSGVALPLTPPSLFLCLPLSCSLYFLQLWETVFEDSFGVNMLFACIRYEQVKGCP